MQPGDEQHDAGGADGRLRVLVVDDHTLFRTGLRNLLEDEGFEVAEARSGQLALQAAAVRAPDVVLMDLNMPGMSGVEATRRIKELSPATPVVMLTVSADDRDVVDAVRAGACGYLLKDAAIEEIVAGIRAVASGESWVAPRVVGTLLARVREASEPAPDTMPAADLTERETQILRLIAEGKDNVEIGDELYISPRTVKNHVSSLLAKLQIENRIQAAVYAVRRGLV
jgi:two-component system nitrate/nitrite response regulator NarL